MDRDAWVTTHPEFDLQIFGNSAPTPTIHHAPGAWIGWVVGKFHRITTEQTTPHTERDVSMGRKWLRCKGSSETGNVHIIDIFGHQACS